MGAGLGDDHSRKGMPDQNRRAILPRQHPFGRRHGFRQCRQRVLHDVTLSPACCNRGMTSSQLEPSANNPCTSTMLRALTCAGLAACPRLEITEAAAPAARPAAKTRLFIMMVAPIGRLSLIGPQWSPLQRRHFMRPLQVLQHLSFGISLFGRSPARAPQRKEMIRFLKDRRPHCDAYCRSIIPQSRYVMPISPERSLSRRGFCLCWRGRRAVHGNRWMAYAPRSFAEARGLVSLNQG